MVVVLGVVAMMAMLALPRFQSARPGLQMRASAEALRADFRGARDTALRLNRETALSIDVETGAWTGEGVAGQAPEGVVLTLETARRELVSEGVGRIRFYPDGGSTGGVVEMRGPSAAIEVRVDWLDGRVAIAEIEPE
jgi:general secretion pathway protein H